MLKLDWGFALLGMVMLVVGCGRVATPTPSPVEDTAVAAAATSTPTFPAPTLTPSPIPTRTPTSTPPLSPTIEETVSPLTEGATITPLPVVLPEVTAEALLVDLLANNDNCLLPCLWGATPGQTLWSDTKWLLWELGGQIDEPDDPMNGVYDVRLPYVPEEINNDTLGLEIFYSVEVGIIQTIKVIAGHTPAYYLQAILENYGPPDEIWLYTMDAPRDGNLGFNIRLLYLEQGFMVALTTDNEELNGGVISACFEPDETQFAQLFLWIPGTISSFIDARVQAGFDRSRGQFLPLHEATDMDVATFYELYQSGGGETCIQTSAELWVAQ